jgi:hypothetical protein
VPLTLGRPGRDGRHLAGHGQSGTP